MPLGFRGVCGGGQLWAGSWKNKRYQVGREAFWHEGTNKAMEMGDWEEVILIGKW